MVKSEREHQSKYSKVVRIGNGNFPVVGIVGNCYENNLVGRRVLDRLQTELGELNFGQVHLVYANLDTPKNLTSFDDLNLNHSFPGKPQGTIWERVAYDLRGSLEECHFVINLQLTPSYHGEFVLSTSGLSEAMVLSIIKGEEIHEVTNEAYKGSGLHPAMRRMTSIDGITSLSQRTGLKNHVQIKEEVSRGRSLTDYVNSHCRGSAISVVAGTHQSQRTEDVTVNVILNVLRSYGIADGSAKIDRAQNFFLGIDKYISQK